MKIICWCMVLVILSGCTMPDKQCRYFNDPEGQRIYFSDDCIRQRETKEKYGWTEYFWKVPVYTVLGVFIVAGTLAGGSGGNSNTSTSSPVKPDAYGQGVGQDAYGRPVTLQGGMPNSHVQTPDAYGPGVHMDQYGNPVQYK